MSENTAVEQPAVERSRGPYVPPTVEDDASPGGSQEQPLDSIEADEGNVPHAVYTPAASNVDDEETKAPIKLRDAVGRKFTFPWHLVNTWDGISGLISEAFKSVEVVGPQVLKGQYDLMSPDGEIILPTVWRHVIQPGWAITMALWPPSAPPPKRPGPPDGPNAPWPWSMPRPPQPPDNPRPPHPPDNIPEDEEILPSRGRLPKSTTFHKKEKMSLPLFRKGLRQPSPPSSLSSLYPSPPPDGFRRRTKLGRDMVPRTSAGTGGVNLKLGLLHGKTSRHRSASPLASPSSSGSSIPRRETRHGGKYGKSHGPRYGRGDGSPYWSSSESDAGLSGTESEVPERIRKLYAHRRFDKPLVVVCKVNDRLVRRPTPHLNGAERHAPPLERLVISSARTCWEGPEKFGLATLELISQKPKPPLSGGQSGGPSARGGHSTWLHVRRKTMSFGEFEDIAQFDLAKDRATSSVISHLLRRIKTEELDDDWYIRPATILRCDTKVGETPAASAIFVSIPYLSPGPFRGVASDADKSEGICPPKRLHEAFNMISASTDRDKDQEFRMNEGRPTDQVLWVRQVWMLITESGLLTYGNISRKDLEGNSIAVREPTGHNKEGETVIQFMDEERKLYYALLSNCKSFYELHIEVRNQLSGAGRDVDDADIQLEVSEGETITAAKWSSLLKETDIPLIKISLNMSPFYSDGSAASDVSSYYGSDQATSAPGSSSELEDDELRDQSRHGIVISGDRSRRIRLIVPEADFLPFRAIPTAERSKESEDSLPNVPELNRKVPPFLAWSSTDKSRTVSEGFSEGVGLTEAALLHPDKFPRSRKPLQELYDAFDGNIYEGMRECSPEDFTRRRRALGGADSSRSPSNTLPFPAGQSQARIDEFFDLSISMFESFVSSGLPSPLTSKFFAALSMIIEDPTRSGLLDESSGGAVDRVVRHEWVISRREVAQYGFHATVPSRDHQYKCRDCDRGRIYSSRDKATAHLRKMHLVMTRSDEELWKCLISVLDARKEWLEEEIDAIFSASRDGIGSILRKLAAVQEGVLFEGEFQAPEQGLPYALLDAFKLIVAFVCAVANTIHEIHWFYRDFEQGRRARDMTSHKHKARKKALVNVGEVVGDLIGKADKALVSMTDETVHDRPENFMTSVGMHYLGVQIMCNLVRMPIHNNKKATGLYEGYVKNLRSAITRHPQKRQIPAITALSEELNLLEEFNEWQTGPLKSFGYLLQPGTYHRDLCRETDRVTLADLEVELFVRQIRELQRDARRLSKIVDLCTRLVQQVRELTEIMEGDQSRAVVVFTVVTVIFLPLSFVASYFSMGGGVEGLEMEWSELQRLFWKTSGPLTAGIIIFCLFLTGRRSLARMKSVVYVPRWVWLWLWSSSRKKSPPEW